MSHNAEKDACGKRLSTRPYWMSEWQYDPDCLLPKGHEGECRCRCDVNEGDDTSVTPPGKGDQP